MTDVQILHTPLTRQIITSLSAGTRVLLSGTLITARDAAHQRLCRALADHQPLPLDLTDQIIYYVGPSPAPPGRPVGAAGPTTSSRMDPFAPTLFAQGVSATIGKGYRSPDVVRTLQQHTALHFTALGGAAALLSRCVNAVDLIAWPELGPEAIYRFTVKDFPLTVAYDCFGRSVYQHQP